MNIYKEIYITWISDISRRNLVTRIKSLKLWLLCRRLLLLLLLLLLLYILLLLELSLIRTIAIRLAISRRLYQRLLGSCHHDLLLHVCIRSLLLLLLLLLWQCRLWLLLLLLLLLLRNHLPQKLCCSICLLKIYRIKNSLLYLLSKMIAIAAYSFLKFLNY